MHVLVYGVGCPGIPLALLSLYIRLQYADSAVLTVKVPGLAVSYIGVELERHVLSQHAYCIYARVGAV